MSNRAWQTAASCSGEDPDLWFLASLAPIAKRICRVCPVRADCLAYALEQGIDHGTWGGLTEDERHQLVVAAREVNRE